MQKAPSAIRVGALALNSTPLDWEGNFERLARGIEEAKSRGIALLCSPELGLTGDGCEDLFLSPFVVEGAEAWLQALLPLTRGIAVLVGMPVRHAGLVFDGALLLCDGRVLGCVAKRILAGDGVHYEPRWFRPWPPGQCDRIRLLGEELPFGDLCFEIGGVLVGVEICEEAWAARRIGASLALDGVDVILNPSASHFAFGKSAIRRRLIAEGSRAFGVAYVYANLLGNEAGRLIYDGHLLIGVPSESPEEPALIEGRRFSFRDYLLLERRVRIDEIRAKRSGWIAWTPRLPRDRTRFVCCDFNWPLAEKRSPRGELPDWESVPHLKHEEFARAVALGLFDYLRKSRAQGFVVSLSGGADSAAIACLVHWMVWAGCEELGMSGFRAKLGHVRGIEACQDQRALVGRLLTTIYQPTANSSAITRKAARAIAEATGATHHEIDVEPMVQAYVQAIEKAIGRKLSWELDDLALQNIQARARSPSAWLLANIEGKLLLATSNRSEAAVGYATMDGDTSGGLSPIAGIDKNYLRSFLRWLEREAPPPFRIPALALVNAQAPTAELRPPQSHQTDEAELMPYDVLDRIERLAVRDRHSPKEVLEILIEERPMDPPQLLGEWIERFFTLFARNQWKRERYAPSFHLDDESLDPKSFFRMPILSCAFVREIEEMWRLVKTRET
ncbi:MAG: NAD(+) synthase [Sandaracinaceae bacterium]|nr:NAD(+) synthase [Sandaracinaceae bacterium]